MIKDELYVMDVNAEGCEFTLDGDDFLCGED